MGAILVALFLAGCAAPIPREDVPADWSLNVHQPGEWWTQPLIPRSVIVQRCPPPRGWSSDPDLTKVTALPPASSVNYYHWVDDYHCSIGWAEQGGTLETPLSTAELKTEAGLRRVCSTSGLPMDAGWRYLGSNTSTRFGDFSEYDEDLDEPDTTVAAFIDRYGTVAGCEAYADAAGMGLSVGADLASGGGIPTCPVTAIPAGYTDDDRVEQYALTGAGAVRDRDGRVLTTAKTLRIGLAGDSLASTHPVVDGIAIVAAEVMTETPVAGDWDNPPPVEGEVLDVNGKVLATCRT